MKRILIVMGLMGLAVTTIQAGWQPKFLKTLNISDKYIVCDVFTSTGINACIDLLGSGGGEVYLPEGIYTGSLSQSIVIDYSSTTITGSGAGTVLDFSAGQPTNGGFDINGKAYVTIQNLKMIGNAGGGSTGDLINADIASQYLTVQNCVFEGSDDAAIWIQGDFSSITNNILIGGDGAGIVIESAARSVVVSGNRGDNISGTFISFTAWYGSLMNNTAFNCKLGIQASCDYSVISGNVLFQTEREAISVFAGATYNTIIGNTVYDTDSGYVDIKVIGDFNVIIGNNLFGIGGSDKGIWLDEADECIVTGNFTDGHDVAGIQEDSDCQNNLIMNNNLQDTVRSIINGTLHEKLDEHITLVDQTGLYVLRAKAGWGHIYASDDASYAYFTFTSAGVVTLVSQNNCTTTQNNDTTLNIYDSGSEATIENELGSTYDFQIDIHYID